MSEPPSDQAPTLRDGTLDNMPPTENSVGQPFGRYRLLQKLGQGGMGVVWRAYDSQLKRVVALKQILRGEEDPKTAERFLREAQAAARLRHPNILGVHEVGVIGGHLYFTNDFILGRSLRQAMDGGPLSAKESVALVKQVADALAYAHGEGIVHRDVKPENILLDQQGKPYVMDFGLAKDVKAEMGPNLTGSGQVLGTPGYMSPEQAEGWSEALGPPSDQFSVGVMLYELLTGVLPFAGKSFGELLDALRHEEPAAPAKLNPRVHRDVDTICRKALEKDPLRRYDSMAALAADLGRWLEGEPIAARPASVMGRLWRRVARNRRVVIPIAGTVIAALVWTAVVVAQGSKRRRVEAEASRLLEEGRGPLEQAQVYLCHEGANYEEMRERVEAGRRLIEQALAKTPDNALGQDLLGRAWGLLGWEEKAEACYREAIRIDPGFGGAHLHLGMLLLDRAIVLKAISIPAASQTEVDERAQACMRLATAEFDTAARSSWAGQDSQSRALVPIAQMFVAGQMQDVARSAMDTATRFGNTPGCERFHLLAALAQEGAARRAALESALQMCPGNTVARFKRARGRGDSGDTDGAIADYDRAIAVNPRFAAAIHNRGWMRHAKGDLDGAIADYGRALALEPHYTWALSNRGLAHQQKGDLEAALADYDQALAIDPRCLGALINRSGAREARGDLEGAISDCDQALAIDPRCLDALINRSSARKAKGDLDGAVADCDQAIAVDSKCVEAYTIRGTARREQRDWRGAIADLDQALLVNPKYANALVGRGNIREDTGDWDGAIADYDQALAIAPGRASAYTGRGIARRAKGNQDGAIADFEQALRLDPKHGAAYLGRGLVRAAKGDHVGAIADFDQVIAINPRDADAFYNRGKARDANGNIQGAIEDYTSALEVAPADWQDRKEVEEKLRSAREKRGK